MSKMAKIERCDDCKKCLDIEGSYWCKELDADINEIFKILPNCPLDDYPEPSETRPKHVKLEFYQCEKCECIYQFYKDSQQKKSCPNCLTYDHIVKFNPELLTSEKK